MEYVTVKADPDALRQIAEQFPACEVTLALGDEEDDPTFQDFVEFIDEEEVPTDEWDVEMG
jgi:hypothetical protein